MSKDLSLRRIFDRTYYTMKENVVKNGGPIKDVCPGASPDGVAALARYSIFELIDIDTQYFEEVLNQYRYRYLYSRYKYLNSKSRKKLN